MILPDPGFFVVCAQFLGKVPVDRMGNPEDEDIAHLVSYLVSEKASFITGEGHDFLTSMSH
jgi:hypothetical protein